nr:unnamed protein product [Spirometra erinaceieuropaei]
MEMSPRVLVDMGSDSVLQGSFPGSLGEAANQPKDLGGPRTGSIKNSEDWNSNIRGQPDSRCQSRKSVCRHLIIPATTATASTTTISLTSCDHTPGILQPSTITTYLIPATNPAMTATSTSSPALATGENNPDILLTTAFTITAPTSSNLDSVPI